MGVVRWRSGMRRAKGGPRQGSRFQACLHRGIATDGARRSAGDECGGHQDGRPLPSRPAVLHARIRISTSGWPPGQLTRRAFLATRRYSLPAALPPSRATCDPSITTPAAGPDREPGWRTAGGTFAYTRAGNGAERRHSLSPTHTPASASPTTAPCLTHHRPLPVPVAPAAPSGCLAAAAPRPKPPADAHTRFFTLHKLRALSRKAKRKGGLLSTDPDTMAAAQTSTSPTSSKRSRSRDSAQSATNSSLDSPAGNTPALATPSVSTNSLVIPWSTPTTPANGDYWVHDGIPYPAFLRATKAQLHAKWNQLEMVQFERMRDGLHAQASEQHYEYARCNTDEFAHRNRYANVNPYVQHRVKMDVPQGQSDYINASPITLTTTKSRTVLRYIATQSLAQGPMADSWSHIWRMIWKENQEEAVIVMLTQTHEQGREKCFPYYPHSPSSPDMRINQHDEFDDGFVHNLHLASLHQDASARTQVREMDMTAEESNESRKIWHLLFAGWPDFSAPEGMDRAALLRLVDMSREKGGDLATNPRIVHCSAGIGRSGTFIALEWLLQELEEGSLDQVADNEDPIVTVIGQLRDQRAGMVQAKVQFLFLYDALREQWRHRWISTHPDEAARLGFVSNAAQTDSEPALKRQKSRRAYDSPPSCVITDASSDPDARAALEAELQGADLSYEKGKT
ncbi:hypothetical protein ACEQ8H_000932 [Pleosporales sp. CAS-2024a]